MRQQSPIWNYEWPTHWLTAVRMAYVGGAEWKSNEGGRLERGCHQSCGGWDWQQDGRWRCLIPIYLKYLSAAASTAAHLLVRRSVAMYCNRSWVLLALLHSASHCCTLLHSTSLRRFVCKECPSASPFNIVPPKPAQEICAHCNVFMWTVYSIASTVGIFGQISNSLPGRRQELQTGQK